MDDNSRLTYWEVMKLSRIYEVLRHSDTWEDLATQIEEELRDEAVKILYEVDERRAAVS